MKQFYGIDMEKTQRSKLLSELPPIDVVVTMGCNVDCSYLPYKHKIDQGSDDPTGKSDGKFVGTVRVIEKKIKELVLRLVPSKET